MGKRSTLIVYSFPWRGTLQNTRRVAAPLISPRHQRSYLRTAPVRRGAPVPMSTGTAPTAVPATGGPRGFQNIIKQQQQNAKAKASSANGTGTSKEDAAATAAAAAGGAGAKVDDKPRGDDIDRGAAPAGAEDDDDDGDFPWDDAEDGEDEERNRRSNGTSLNGHRETDTVTDAGGSGGGGAGSGGKRGRDGMESDDAMRGGVGGGGGGGGGGGVGEGNGKKRGSILRPTRGGDNNDHASANDAKVNAVLGRLLMKKPAAAADPNPEVGPGRYCSPRHMRPSNSAWHILLTLSYDAI